MLRSTVQPAGHGSVLDWDAVAMTKGNWEFLVCLDGSKRVRIDICRTSGFWAESASENSDDFTGGAMILDFGIVGSKIESDLITDIVRVPH